MCELGRFSKVRSQMILIIILHAQCLTVPNCKLQDLAIVVWAICEDQNALKFVITCLLVCNLSTSHGLVGKSHRIMAIFYIAVFVIVGQF